MKSIPSNPINGDNSFLSLASVSQPLEGGLTSQEAIEAAGRRALTLSQAQRCAILLRQPDGLYICPWKEGLSNKSIQTILSEATQWAIGAFTARGGPVLVPDTRRAEGSSALTALADEEGYRAVHLWPMESSRGTPMGVIACFFDRPHALTKAQYKSMTGLIGQVRPVFENVLPVIEQRPVMVLNGLYDLSRQLVVNDTLDILLERFVQTAVDIVQVSFCRVLTLEREDAFSCQAAFPARLPCGTKPNLEPPAAQQVYKRVAQAEAPFLLKRGDVTLTYEARVALELDQAHTLCLAPLRVNTELVGILVLGETRGQEVFHLDKVRLTGAIADLVASVIHRERLHHRLEDSYVETILALTRTLEARDPYTAGHSNKLVELVEKTGRRMGITAARLKSLRWAALLHDIGKIGVPDEILRRPGPLTEEEWEIMKQHPQIGADIILPVSQLAHVAPFVLAHHERYDGSGYPYGLKGEEIPLEARVLSVVDAYCAMTDGRIYRAAKTHEDACAELVRCAGNHFDARVVEEFLTLIQGEQHTRPAV